MKPLTYLLVDFENLQPLASDVALVRGDEYRLWVFRGPHQNKFAAELVEAWQPLGDKVHFVQSSKPGKNALDFHIAFSLGLLNEENRAAGRAARYVVVSADGGFEPLFDHMRKDLNCPVGKASSIPEALALAEALTAALSDTAASQPPRAHPAPVAKAPQRNPPVPSFAKKAATKTTAPLRNSVAEGDAAKVIAHLRSHPKNRPADRKALQHHIVSILGNKVTAQVSEAVVQALEHQQIVKLNGSKIEYKVPKAKK